MALYKLTLDLLTYLLYYFSLFV